jgi:EAL domain-containing protein (putative c-di-GMP-specific phosphodiesterase class I)
MKKLCFEITETVALADQGATKRFAHRVHSMGGKVALDDFGAGYTSFTYLARSRRHHQDRRQFCSRHHAQPGKSRNHPHDRGSIHELGKRCVAEWAEEPHVVATLMQMGVDYGQGYALARPMSPEALLLAGAVVNSSPSRR